MISIESIAKCCHEANKAYCEAIGDASQRHWDEAEAWQKESAILGVQFAKDNPKAPDSAQHDQWCKVKFKDGWEYGPVKDTVKKEHPCLVSFHHLPIEQQIKDKLFRAVCASLLSLAGE